MLLDLLGWDSWICADSAPASLDDQRRELRQALARGAHRRRRDGDRGDHRSPHAAHRGGRRAQAGLELLPRRRVAGAPDLRRAPRSRSAIVVIVPGPSLASRPNGGWAAPKAMKTLPIDEAWIGIRAPTQLPAPSGWRAVDLGQPGDASGCRDGDVRRLARRPSELARGTGNASVARSPTLESRRAYSTSTGPGRKPPPGRRWARPLRSSARRSRAAVDFGSCVSSMTPFSVTASSLSTRRTRIRAARSIAWEPSTIFAMGAALWHSTDPLRQATYKRRLYTICAECRSVAPGSVREDGARHGYATN